MEKSNNNYMENEEWKKKDEKYWKEVQAFLDMASNIEDEERKNALIIQMLKCDKQLTLLAEELFKRYYKEGYEKGRKEK